MTWYSTRLGWRTWRQAIESQNTRSAARRARGLARGKAWTASVWRGGRDELVLHALGVAYLAAGNRIAEHEVGGAQSARAGERQGVDGECMARRHCGSEQALGRAQEQLAHRHHRDHRRLAQLANPRHLLASRAEGKGNGGAVFGRQAVNVRQGIPAIRARPFGALLAPGRHSDMDAVYFQFATLIQAGRIPGTNSDLPDAETLSWGHAMKPETIYPNP